METETVDSCRYCTLYDSEYDGCSRLDPNETGSKESKYRGTPPPPECPLRRGPLLIQLAKDV